MVMRVLFLDDDAERHTRFARALVGTNKVVTYVWNYEEALDALRGPRFDLAHLDHDLSFEQQEACVQGTEPPRERSGTDVADYISNMSEDTRPYMCIIHSFNPVGAQRMASILRGAGIQVIVAPFDY